MMFMGGRVCFDTFAAQDSTSQIRRLLRSSQSKICSGSGVCLGGILFTCCARGQRFHQRPNAESREFASVMSPAPLVGMFAGGEIGPRRIPSRSRRRRRSPNPTPDLMGYTAVYGMISIHKVLVDNH
mmetsp:Transcript_21292/g.41320  ORF Transcript_21292/g.41320 Transcript_21292/m.41320 type:complete len:127 (-) Transcript_21292:181-561(-)